MDRSPGEGWGRQEHYTFAQFPAALVETVRLGSPASAGMVPRGASAALPNSRFPRQRGDGPADCFPWHW